MHSPAARGRRPRGRKILEVEVVFAGGHDDGRESLAALATLDALRHRTDDDVNVLQDHLSKIEAALDDDDEFQRATWQLHEQIAGIGANRVLQTVYRGVLAYVEANERPDRAPARTDSDRRRALRLHQQLVDAIVEQDERACRRAIRAMAP